MYNLLELSIMGSDIGRRRKCVLTYRFIMIQNLETKKERKINNLILCVESCEFESLL